MLCVRAQSSREPVEASSSKTVQTGRNLRYVGGNAYECQPYSRNALKIRGTRIATFKGDNQAFVSLRLRFLTVTDIINLATDFVNYASPGQ